jgi:CRISPR-associated protein Csb3
MLLNWWQGKDSVDSDGSLKTWAGQQRVSTIAQAMLRHALKVEIDEKWLNRGVIPHADGRDRDTIAPFYFDARRFAHSLDTGFSLDVQKAPTFAYPAVEILALIGLQRFRPRSAAKRRFRYRTWTHMLQPSVAAAVACGVVNGAANYEFQLLSRDDQDRYKAFGFATFMGD